MLCVMEPRWDERGLVPAIAQDATTGKVLMVAWMNEEALRATEETGLAHFWSRSRMRLWKKGEESGNVLRVAEIRIDCDQDVILLAVEPAGPACHTGKPSCFYRTLAGGEDAGPAGNVLSRIDAVIEARKGAAAEKSYVKSLFAGGWPRIREKIEEEAGELLEVLESGDDKDVIHETADLLFHVMVGLSARGLTMERVMAELQRRFGVSGHDEKAARKK